MKNNKIKKQEEIPDELLRESPKTENTAELSEQIVDWLSSGDYIPCKPEELIENMNLADHREDFITAMCELEDKGRIVSMKRGKISLTENSPYLRGIFRANAKGFGFVVPEETFSSRLDGDLYISSENTCGAVNGDTVLAAQIKSSRSGNGKSCEGIIVHIIDHELTELSGTVEPVPPLQRESRCSSGLCVRPDKSIYNFLVLLDDGGSTLPHIGSSVQVKLLSYPDKNGCASGVITEVFGESGTTDAVYASILYEYGIKPENGGGFSDALLLQAREISDRGIIYDNSEEHTGGDLEGRKDLRGEMIFTLDGADAKDLDDAINVHRDGDGWILGVHIADVSHYIKFKSPLDCEALSRGTSIYLTDRVIPMLPRPISNGICSLTAGTDRLTVSAIIKIDANGNIIGTDLCESVINSKIRGVYSEFNDFIEKSTSSDYYDKYAVLGNMADDCVQLYRLLERKSKERGALELETSEAAILLDADGNPTGITVFERGIGERMIEQFMLCANTAVASCLNRKKIPCVYRIHEEPSPEKIHNFAVFAHNLGLNVSALGAKNVSPESISLILKEAAQKEIGTVVSYVLLRSLMKARYDSKCSPHFGLSTDMYCHFTSPIRRYPDLTVHRFIKLMINGKLSGKELKEAEIFAGKSAEKSNENELRAISAERAVEELYKVRYMSGFINEEFDGIVSSVTSFGIFVELPNTCEGLVPVSGMNGYFVYNEELLTLSDGRTVFRLGNRVRVKLISADIVHRKLEFSLVGTNNGDTVSKEKNHLKYNYRKKSMKNKKFYKRKNHNQTSEIKRGRKRHRKKRS